MSYSDGVSILVDKDVQDDINDACNKLAHSMNAMMDKFDSIAKQMHTLDLLRHTAPLKPRWESMRRVYTPRVVWPAFHNADVDMPLQDVAELLWQFRTNAGVISGRLKREPFLLFVCSCIDVIIYHSVFCTAVLPMAARNIDGRSGGKSQYHRESLQVLQSFMTVSG